MKRSNFLLAAAWLGAMSLPAMAQPSPAMQQATSDFPKTEQEAERFSGNLAQVAVNFLVNRPAARWRERGTTKATGEKRFGAASVMDGKLAISVQYEINDELGGTLVRKIDYSIPLDRIGFVIARNMYPDSQPEKETYILELQVVKGRKAISESNTVTKNWDHIGFAKENVVGETKEQAVGTVVFETVMTEREARVIAVLFRRLIEAWGGSPKLVLSDLDN